MTTVLDNAKRQHREAEASLKAANGQLQELDADLASLAERAPMTGAALATYAQTHAKLVATRDLCLRLQRVVSERRAAVDAAERDEAGRPQREAAARAAAKAQAMAVDERNAITLVQKHVSAWERRTAFPFPTAAANPPLTREMIRHGLPGVREGMDDEPRFVITDLDEFDSFVRRHVPEFRQGESAVLPLLLRSFGPPAQKVTAGITAFQPTR